MITTPWKFNNNDEMNRWISQFEQQARMICNRNGDPGYFGTIRYYKNTNIPEVAIESIGLYAKDTGQEKACKEIISLFNQD